MSKKSKDLYLKHKFTDRGGDEVYYIYPMPDGVEIMQRPEEIMGEIRIDHNAPEEPFS